MTRNWKWLCFLAIQLAVLARTTHGENGDHISVGYEKSVYVVNENQISVQLCVVVTSPKTRMAPRPFNISASTSNGSAMAGRAYDAIVNVSLEFQAGVGKICHTIKIRDNDECGDVLSSQFSSHLNRTSNDTLLEIHPASAVVKIADPECSCSDISPPDNSPLKPSFQTKTQKWSYSCKDGYLLVGPAVRVCSNDVWSDESPRCKAVPSIHFEKKHVMVDMREKYLSIPIITGTIVKPVIVNVSTAVYNTQSEAEKANEPHDFQVVQKMFNYSESEQSHSIVVHLNDTGISGRTKSFILCLSVENDPNANSDGPDANKEWAKITTPNCISVHINNSYLFVVSLLEDSYIFTSRHQSLGFSVGFRDCNISLRLQLGNLIGTVVTIPKGCGDHNTPCIVNLLGQREGIAVDAKMVGDYRATLVPHTSDCQINTKKSTLEAMVSLTLSAQELHEFATTLSFSSQQYNVHVNGSLFNVDDLQVVLTPPPLYPFLFNITVRRKGSLSRDQLVVEEVDVDPQFDSLVEINNWDEQNNSWVYNFSSSLEMAVRSMQPSCGMSDELELQVVALTSPFDAVVSSPASLSVFYEIAFGFKPGPKDTVSPIVVGSTRCFRGNISKILTVSSLSGDKLRLVPQNTTSVPQNTTSVPLNNSWIVVPLPPLEPLDKLSLLLNHISSADKHFTISKNFTSYFTEMSVQFSQKSYTCVLPATEPVIVIIAATSPAPTPWTKLQQTAGVIKVTANTTMDLKDPEFKDGVGWVVPVSTNQNIRLTLSVDGSFQEFVRVGEISSCTIEVITTTTESSGFDSKTDESTFSFTPIVIVFILLLTVAVALYVTYSRRHQIVEWVRSVGGWNADSGDHKARSRMRGRGAYKKLPTSVQDAMRRHND